MGKEEDRFIPVHEGDSEPLFETRRRIGTVIAYRVFSASVFVCICLIWFYRVFVPVEIDESRTGLVRLLSLVMLFAEICFGLYWVVTESSRWSPVWRFTFADRLSRRYGNDLPRLDVFICTADPVIEPPLLVVNTVLSVAALDYPPEKLAVYLSDDGGSELTFYAVTEAAEFAKTWVPLSRDLQKLTCLPKQMVLILRLRRRWLSCIEKWQRGLKLRRNSGEYRRRHG